MANSPVVMKEPPENHSHRPFYQSYDLPQHPESAFQKFSSFYFVSHHLNSGSSVTKGLFSSRKSSFKTRTL